VGVFRRSKLSAAAVLVAGLLVAGCEAQLNLSGVEWQRSQTKMRFDMYQAIAANETATVTVSSTGVILVSDNAGFTWTRNELEGNPTLIDVAVCPDGRFVALDTRRLIWTGSGDGNWTSRPIDTMENVLALTCDPQDRIWVTGSFSTLLHSTDDGASWEMTSFDEDLQFTTIQFLDAGWGVATGEFGTVMITRDAGVSWEAVEYIPNEFYPMAAVFTDQENGWVIGLNGITWSTTDGAASWQRIDAPSPTPLYGIAAEGDRVYIVGEGGSVFSWDGSSWRSPAGLSSLLAYLRGVVVLDDSTILVAGGFGALMRVSTTDTVAMVAEEVSP
jgi:photosystem II stability/assembly factor-like uncharacterized protein